MADVPDSVTEAMNLESERRARAEADGFMRYEPLELGNSAVPIREYLRVLGRQQAAEALLKRVHERGWVDSQALLAGDIKRFLGGK